MIKKLTISAAATVLFLSAVAPAFAATAYNTNISGGSIAKAKAIEKKTIRLRVRNERTTISNTNMIMANSGVNQQNNNDDGNQIYAEPAQADGSNTVNANHTSIVIY